MLLQHRQRVEVGLLLELLLDLGNYGRQIGLVLLGLRPLVLRQQLVLQRQLEGAADSVDAVVALLWRKPLQSQLHHLILLFDEVVRSVVVDESSVTARGAECWPIHDGLRR